MHGLKGDSMETGAAVAVLRHNLPMRLLVFSDIHNDMAALAKLIESRPITTSPRATR